ncbi:1-phosphofructokinase family hexose kinase [Paracoccus suum]|uniref:Phosphofructokinase n=1 Tax=Paracoccus suum TaxID=2259340 RepID=A0A344PNI5_9RHOB|nr:hexose kinase [Paracoccus suum]AXC50940.1 1-phosphofructokinase family hexose kinase [Paracoccus suum]
MTIGGLGGPGQGGPQTPILTVTLNPAFDLATRIDRVIPDIKLRCAAPLADPGGGGINVSRAIARLGGDSRAAVSLGGPTGARMSALLAEGGIATVTLPAPGETRLSLAVTEELTGQQFRFMLPGPDWTQPDAEAAIAAVVAVAGHGGMVVLSGSTPPGIGADIAARLARALPAGAGLTVDTSGAALADVAAARTRLAVLRMDGEEAEALAGRPLLSREASAGFAAQLVADGAAEVVMVARGGDGNILASAEGVWHAEALRVQIVSRVGAGDSFVAGYTLARARGEGLPQALAWAAACASATCMSPATELCRLEDVIALHAAGSVTRMA